MAEIYVLATGVIVGAVGVVTPLCFWVVKFVNGKTSSKVSNKECRERVLRLTESISSLKELHTQRADNTEDRLKDIKTLVCSRFDAIEKLISGNKLV